MMKTIPNISGAFLMRKSFVFVVLILFSLIYSLSLAEIPNGRGYGGFVRYNFINHFSNFQKLPYIPNCCPKFDKGSGDGFEFGLLYKQPLSESVSLQANIGFAPLSGLFTSYEQTFVAIGDESIKGEFEHTLDISLATLNLEPMFSYKLFGDFKLNLGFSIGLLLYKKYEQKEEIVSPSDVGTFLDRNGDDTFLRVRNEDNGDLPDVSVFQSSLSAGISYELPLNEKGGIVLVPEAYYSYLFTPIIKDLDWAISTFKIGISVYYNNAGKSNDTIIIDDQDKNMPDIDKAKELELTVGASDPLYDKFDVKDTVKTEIEKPKPVLTASVYAVGVAQKIEYPKATMVIEEFLSTHMRPLLNYIFFEDNSSEIPDRYNKMTKLQANDFVIDQLSNVPTLPTYYNIMNIVGRRMLENPESEITLVGNNSNSGRERGSKTLSKTRAEEVKSYLTSIWEISSDRIKIKSQNLPAKPSNATKKDGIEENRRVEILSDNWKIIQPVSTNDTLRVASPPIFRFYMDSQADDGISSWKLTIKQNGVTLKEFSGHDSLPKYKDWFIDREKETMPKYTQSLEFTLEVHDAKDQKAVSVIGELPLDQITIQKKMINRVGDKRIDRYSLILYDFNSFELSINNKKISDIIKSNLDNESRMLISGYTDRIGDEKHNEQLSKDRAEVLSGLFPDHKVFTRAVGESELLYDNHFPEGRFYCRTVVVEVETPLKW